MYMTAGIIVYKKSPWKNITLFLFLINNETFLALLDGKSFLLCSIFANLFAIIILLSFFHNNSSALEICDILRHALWYFCDTSVFLNRTTCYWFMNFSYCYTFFKITNDKFFHHTKNNNKTYLFVGLNLFNYIILMNKAFVFF